MYKKLSYLLLAIGGLSMVSCDKTMDDVYNKLDAAQVPLNKAVAYTLTKTDYEAISKVALGEATNPSDSALARAAAGSLSLNSFVTADKYVPERLKVAFPALNKNSTAQVSYAYTEDYLATLAGASTYTLTTADYESVWGEESTTAFLTPSTPPSAKLPAILASQYPDATDGEVVLVSYKYADAEPGPSPTRLSEDYNTYTPSASAPYTQWDQNGWTQVMTKGTKYWRVRTRTVSGVPTYYSEVTANGTPYEMESEIYVVSSLVDLTQTTNNEFSFEVCVGYWNSDGLAVLITEDANAPTDPAGVTWTDVTANFTVPSEPVSGYGAWGAAGTMNLDAGYAGKRIYIAFKYTGGYPDAPERTNPKTTTYQLDNILVKGTAPGSTTDVTPRVENAVYTYGGSAWTTYPDACILHPADYTAMGLTNGTMSTSAASSYLPTYLSSLYPYAQDGSKKAVVYKSTASAYSANEYVFTGGQWTPSLAGALKTEQFVHTGAEWIFDPTVHLTMLRDDYQLVITSVLNDPVLGVYTRGTYTNEEWYYGFNAYYVNVSFRLSGSTSSSRDVESSKQYDTELHSLTTNEEKNALLWKRLTEEGMIKFLQLKYPDSPVDVQGIPLYYNITLNVYYPDGVTNTTYTYVLKYKVLTAGSVGTPPTFEYMEKEQI